MSITCIWNNLLSLLARKPFGINRIANFYLSCPREIDLSFNKLCDLGNKISFGEGSPRIY
jgi:hypothetical protein